VSEHLKRHSNLTRTTIVHPRITLLIFAVCLSGCSLLGRRTTPDIPEDEARHRAALTELSVNNQTNQSLTIAFRSATPPAQEIVLGTVPPGKQQKVAPVPAGEPIVLVARRRDGKELLLTAHSYPIDGEWTWEIPANSPFR
jgi:hypothetical protein